MTRPQGNGNDGRPRILLAEDDEELRQVLVEKFEEHGMDVTACRDGLELVEVLDRAFGAGGQDDVDVVVTDIRMPGVTGMEMLEGLNAFGRRCPVILMTAFGDDETHARARRLCATAIFDKPFDADRLLEKVEEALERN